jgi:chemotaxis protein methyltransferase CheR
VLFIVESPPAITYAKLTDKEFLLFQKLVYDKCGINLHEGKKELVRSRLAKRLRQHHFNRFEDYYQYLMAEDTGNELVQMLDAISTNLTSFFRESKHFDFLKEEVLPGFLKPADGPAAKLLNVWSAGCSSGEEPYTLSICLREFMDSQYSFDYRILATDISTQMLTTAANGVYHQNQTRSVSNQILRKYFQRGNGQWAHHVRLKRDIRNPIEFKRFNLMDPFPHRDYFHVIFCRNVMIYFDRQVQQAVVNKFYNALVPGGFLFIGHSESLMGSNHQFQYIRPTIYQK